MPDSEVKTGSEAGGEREPRHRSQVSGLCNTRKVALHNEVRRIDGSSKVSFDTCAQRELFGLG
jgi:hypothetical protein